MLLLIASLSAQEDVDKFSEAMGHLIGKNFQSMGLKVNLEALVRGIEAEAEGKGSPLEEEEYIEWMAAYQQEHLGKIAAENLSKAQSFLVENQKKEKIHALEEGKLQYEIVKEGTGESVQAYNTPLVRLKGRFQNGEEIGEIEESLSLDRTIEGISLGLVGMREGEKRILYVHPDLGFQDQRGIETGSLLIFEVEVLKADISSAANATEENSDENPVFLRAPDEADLPRELLNKANL